ncbi:MAG: hypothetical protein ACOC5T_05515 [Elusimicrobiota bacterium]
MDVVQCPNCGEVFKLESEWDIDDDELIICPFCGERF